MSDIEESESKSPPYEEDGSGDSPPENEIEEANEDHDLNEAVESPSSIPLEHVQTSHESMDIEEPTVIDDEKKKMLEEFERRKRARLITVPTDDNEVKNILRMRGEPICLFAEGPADRRNRLKDFLSRQEDSEKGKDVDMILSEGEESDDSSTSGPAEAVREDETWYHKGPNSLKESRMFIVNYSVPRARGRLKKEKLEKEIPEAMLKAQKQELQAKLRSFGLVGSQNADTRPVSYCSFSPNGEMLATSSWSGLTKIWEIPNCTELRCLRGHNAFTDCIEWHPGSTVTVDQSSLNLASCSRDGMVYLWNLTSSDPIDFLPKFEKRVSRIKFHPSGRFIGVCIHDNSWRLWDIQVSEEVLFQEGHSKEVYCIGFQKDGALAATGGMDAFGRVWDLRTGRCIMFLNGHSGSILSLDWSPDGYHVATGSEDNSARIWDVRARRCVYTIPAHTSLVSGLSYDPNGGRFLVTGSYDGSVKLWRHGSFHLLKSFEGHGQKIMGTAIAPDGNLIATCSFDRTFKLWGPE